MRSSRRQRASTKLARAFARALDAGGKKPEAVNGYMTMLLKMYESIDDPHEQARMMYNMIPAGVAAEFFYDLFKDGSLLKMVYALKEINQDLGDVVGDIIISYCVLLLCEIGETAKHTTRLFSQSILKLIPGIAYKKGSIYQEQRKLGSHLRRIRKSHPTKIALGGLHYFRKAKTYNTIL
jgi:hypothetical protein